MAAKVVLDIPEVVYILPEGAARGVVLLNS